MKTSEDLGFILFYQQEKKIVQSAHFSNKQCTYNLFINKGESYVTHL